MEHTRQFSTINGYTSGTTIPPIDLIAFPYTNEVSLPVVITDPPKIQCKRCLGWKPQTEEYFYRHHKRNWWQSWCKECQKQRMVQVRAQRKTESLSSPYMNATLGFLRRQLVVVATQEAKALKALAISSDARIRIGQAIAALLREGECNGASTAENSSIGK